MSTHVDNKELVKLIDLCRKKGIKSLKWEGIELELNQEAPLSPYKQRKLKASKAEESIQTPDVYSEEDLLYWSSQQIPNSLLHTESH